MYTKLVSFNSGPSITLRWPDFKATVVSKGIRIQYVEVEDSYLVFSLDSLISYSCTLIKTDFSSTYQFTDNTPDYSQSQNDTDVVEFETYYKPSANTLIKSDGGSASFVSGYSSTSSIARAGIFATPYTEQLTNAQRSVSSSSASDTAAGTGAQTILITYYDQTMSGPFTETVTLNGTANVNTVGTNICFIESMRIQTVGSLGNNQGTISLFISAGGGGGTIGTIAVNDNQTNWCHHYVAKDKTLFLTQVLGGNQGSSNGSLTVLKTTPTISNSTDLVIIPQLRVPSGTTESVAFSSPVRVSGPARIQLQVRQDAASGNNNWFAGLAYQEV
jgi:hypothetical protein